MAVRPITLSLLLLCGLAAIEGVSYWWMHPVATDTNQPKLVYAVPQPSIWQSGLTQESKAVSGENPISTNADADTITPMPEVIEQTIATLNCSTGSVAKIERANGIVIHVAFFEWNKNDSTNVLEAYRHLPDECMGSIGMKLMGQMPPKFYTVGNEQMLFDHTMFRDQVGRIIHAFKGTWVSGAVKLIGPDFRGGAGQWRQIRFKAALSRFSPSYARVAQGSVRGIPDPQLAWQSFEEVMLKNLSMR